MPLTQHAMVIHGDIAYHDYEGVALDLDERDRLVNDLRDRNLMILRNHGTLAVGRTCGDAFIRMYFLERACSMQVRALSASPNRPNQGVPEKTAALGGLAGDYVSALAWPALLRKLDRMNAGYKH